MSEALSNWDALLGLSGRKLSSRANNSYCFGFLAEELERIRNNIPKKQVFFSEEKEDLKIGKRALGKPTEIVAENIVVDFSKENWMLGDPYKSLLCDFLFSVEPYKMSDVVKYLSQIKEFVNFHLFNSEFLPRESFDRLGLLIEVGGTPNFSRNRIYPIINIWTTSSEVEYPHKSNGRKVDDREDFTPYSKGMLI